MLRRPAPPEGVHEDIPHHPGCQVRALRAIANLESLISRQGQASFVDK